MKRRDNFTLQFLTAGQFSHGLGHNRRFSFTARIDELIPTPLNVVVSSEEILEHLMRRDDDDKYNFRGFLGGDSLECGLLLVAVS
jgi:hypothetical protein